MASSSSKRESSQSLDKAKRLRIVSELGSINGVSKTGLSKTLQALYDHGLLTDALVEVPTERGYLKQVNHAFELDAVERCTPYGPMLNELTLPTEGDGRQKSMWYLSPFALLYTICSISSQFFQLLKSVMVGTKGLRVILYLDGINPGNPLAPDPQKLLQAIYWTFAELPNWFLRRKDAWFCFSLVRELWAEQLPGQLSELTRLILLIFFGEHGTAFQKGISVSCGEEAFVLVATFGGILADEKGLKQIFGITGQAGSVPCISCLNVRNRWCTLKPGEQFFWDPEVGKRTKTNRKHIELILRRLADAPNTKERKRLQTATGFNFVPRGRLFDSWLMSSIIIPDSIYLRDWMHTFVSNGVASTHLALLCQSLEAVKVAITVLQQYSRKFVLPRSRGGKTSDLYFKSDLIATDHVRHFASDVLGMITIMYCFLIDKIEPKGLLQLNIECFSCLHAIMCILRRGDMNSAIYTTLRDLCIKHNRLFLELYGNTHAKIKFHHIYHIADAMWFLQSCLSCFPTERKNKDAIAVSIANDKGMERTSVAKFLHRTLKHWEQHMNCCTEQFLINPRVSSISGQRVLISTSGTFRCSDIHTNDIVLLVDGSLGKVVSLCTGCDETIILGVEIHRKCADARLQYELNPYQVDFIDARQVVEPVFWYSGVDAIIAAAPAYE